MRSQNPISWLPLTSQQMRLRNVTKITGHHLQLNRESLVYFTIHLNSLSVPIFTSEKKTGSPSEEIVDWPCITSETISKSPSKCLCIKVWEDSKSNSENCDNQVLSYGIYLSGLVPVPVEGSFTLAPNSLVLQMTGGFSFTAPNSIIFNIDPFDDFKSDQSSQRSQSSLGSNAIECNGEALRLPEETKSNQSDLRVRYKTLDRPVWEVLRSCSVDQLLKLRKKQMQVKYQQETLSEVMTEIRMKSAFCLDLNLVQSPNKSNYNSRRRRSQHTHSSMGRTLTKLLSSEPEQVDPQVVLKAHQLRTEIEASRFRCRLLKIERDRAIEYVNNLKSMLSRQCDMNIETGSFIMAGYHAMSKEKENSLHTKLIHTKQQELFATVRKNLLKRRQFLLRELNDIFEVKEHEGNHFTINGISLPDAESFKISTPPLSVSIALGYVAHVVLTCSLILNVPLRNPIKFEGSQSKIIDNIKMLANNDRVFPLYCRIMPPPELTLYAIYLLNQNIAQLQFQLDIPRVDIRSTLANLMKITTNCQLVEVGEECRTSQNASDLRSISNYGSSVDMTTMPLCSPERDERDNISLADQNQETPKTRHRSTRSMDIDYKDAIAQMTSENIFNSEPLLRSNDKDQDNMLM